MNQELFIGFVGPYSTANLGDYGMLVNNIYDLAVKNITVFTYSTKMPQVSLDVYCNSYNIKYIEPTIKDNLELSTPTNITPIEILDCISNVNEIIQAISSLDVLIVSGGGWLNHFWGKRKDKLFKVIAPLLIAKQLGKKIVFTANGIGPFDSKAEFFRYFFSYLGDNISIAVRDKQFSPLYANDVGISKESLSHIPDDLLIINESLLSRNLTFKIKSQNYIVMEMFYPMKDLEKEIKRIISFAKKIKKTYDLNIVFLPFDLISYGLYQARYLHKNIKESELIDIEKMGFLPVQDAFNIIKNAQLMISSRYHGLVLSLSAQTPVIYRTLPTNNDMRYSYSKALGLIRTVFKGISFDEHQFMVTNLLDSLNKVENNLPEIIDKQTKLLSSNTFKNNMNYLKEERDQYLKSKIVSHNT